MVKDLVINFEIVSGGFGYKESEELRLSIGGTTGIQTTSSYDPFILTVSDVYRDTFNGFTIGEIDVFDQIDDQFDGVETRFQLKIDDKSFGHRNCRWVQYQYRQHV